MRKTSPFLPERAKDLAEEELGGILCRYLSTQTKAEKERLARELGYSLCGLYNLTAWASGWVKDKYIVMPYSPKDFSVLKLSKRLRISPLATG